MSQKFKVLLTTSKVFFDVVETLNFLDSHKLNDSEHIIYYFFLKPNNLEIEQSGITISRTYACGCSQQTFEDIISQTAFILLSKDSANGRI